MLELRSISKTFQTDGWTVSALSNVSMLLRQNEYVRLQGPNGSGKTTILSIIAGRYNPDEGSVWYRDQEITTIPEHGRHFAGRIFQDAREASCDELTILESLCLAQIGNKPSAFRIAVSHSRRAAAVMALEQAGFSHLRDRLDAPLRYLSGGERQVINVLCLRLRTPEAKLILADEPSNHLDPRNAERVLTLLAELATARTVVLVSHQRELEPGVQRIVSLDEGRIIDDRRVQ